VTGFTVGERVAVGAITPCFRCSFCQRGFTSQCQGMLGGYKYTTQIDGNLAEYFVVPAAQANLTRIPADVPDDSAVYVTDMLSTGFAGVENAALRIGESVAVFAQGPVGLAATIGCRLVGAGLIIAVESVPKRQEMARRFGADVIVDYTKGDPVEQILEITGGQGVDAAIEAFGFPQTFGPRSAAPSREDGSPTSATTARIPRRWRFPFSPSAWACPTRASTPRCAPAAASAWAGCCASSSRVGSIPRR
jgi:isopropanol dehydrogenase (NADP+)